MNVSRILRTTTEVLFRAFFVATRLVAIAAIYGIPMLFAAFAEWSWLPGSWSLVTRTVVALIWLALTALFVMVLFENAGGRVRKAGEH